MATIIKSNKIATGDFLVQTPFGNTYPEVAEYLDIQTSELSNITQAQFDALHNLHYRLREYNLYDNVLEIMPFLGDKILAQFGKSKYVRNSRLIGLSGMGTVESNRDSDKGLVWDHYRLSVALSLDTGLVDSDFVNGMRFSTYTDLTPASNAFMCIIGKGPTQVNLNTRAFFQNGGDLLGISTQGTAFSSTEKINGPCLISGFLKINSGTVVQRNGYKDLDIIANNEPAAVSNTNALKYYIGGLNQDNIDYPLFGLVGKMRFFIITNGNISEAENIALINICQQYIVEAGKI